MVEPHPTILMASQLAMTPVCATRLTLRAARPRLAARPALAARRSRTVAVRARVAAAAPDNQPHPVRAPPHRTQAPCCPVRCGS